MKPELKQLGMMISSSKVFEKHYNNFMDSIKKDCTEEEPASTPADSDYSDVADEDEESKETSEATK